MCGIFAQFGELETEQARNQALRKLLHRGPDAEGTWESADGKAWLAQRRLSIVDLSDAGRQPMHNEDNTLWLTANGEIYNYPRLRIRLESMGHTFYSNSDSEFILHAYEQWGDLCVEHLEGMFAFILWDEFKKRVFCARDRVGIKPLYYVELASRLTLASEACSLLSGAQSLSKINPMALAYMLTLGYIPSPVSIWKDIHKLEAGQVLTWREGSEVQITQYWVPPVDIEDGKRDSEWQELFETVLSEHLLADVPIGLFLSGGLDLSSVAVGLHDIHQPLHALSVSFPNSGFDEAPLAREVALRLNFPQTVVPLAAEGIYGVLQETMSAFDEPQGFSALLSMKMICKEASKGFKVVLAGDGGDEDFGGYTWYGNLNKKLPRYAIYARKSLRPLIRRNASPCLRMQASKSFSSASILHRHAWRVYPRFLPEEAELLLSPVGLRFGDEAMLAPLQKHFVSSLPIKRGCSNVWI